MIFICELIQQAQRPLFNILKVTTSVSLLLLEHKYSLSSVYSCGIMSDKSELKAELERKKQRLAQIREEKKRKEEERKKKEVCKNLCNIVVNM